MLIIIKENGEVKKFNSLSDCTLFYTCHLCGEDCKNLDPRICSKTLYEKQEIGEYDYITDGYQIYSDDGRLEKFIVSGCKNYEGFFKPLILDRDDKKKKSIKKGSSERYYLSKLRDTRNESGLDNKKEKTTQGSKTRIRQRNFYYR